MGRNYKKVATVYASPLGANFEEASAYIPRCMLLRGLVGYEATPLQLQLLYPNPAIGLVWSPIVQWYIVLSFVGGVWATLFLQAMLRLCPSHALCAGCGTERELFSSPCLMKGYAGSLLRRSEGYRCFVCVRVLAHINTSYQCLLFRSLLAWMRVVFMYFMSQSSLVPLSLPLTKFHHLMQLGVSVRSRCRQSLARA